MRDITFEYIVDELKKNFEGFKIVSCHADKVKIICKTLLSSKSFLGIKYKTEYCLKEKEIEFVSTHVMKTKYCNIEIEKYEVLTAIDWDNKTLYWKFDKLIGG